MAEFRKPKKDLIKPGTTQPQIDRAAVIKENKSAAFIVRGFGLQRLQTKFFNVDEELSDAEVSKGNFGLPVFTNLEIEGGSYQFFNEDTQQNEINTYAGVTLDTVLMTVSMAKNIVTTQIQGRNGTIKEYVSDGDFEIDVRGVIVGDGQNEYPSLDVEELVRLLTVPDTLTVTSDFLSRFSSISPLGIEGIDNVVITDFSLPQREGFRNAQLFQFKMLSNEPIELTI
jgi:hypothetical protein